MKKKIIKYFSDFRGVIFKKCPKMTLRGAPTSSLWGFLIYFYVFWLKVITIHLF